MPKVTVIMPSLNVAQYIRECMESVIRQTLSDIEIICVDAGSTDGTLEVLHEFAQQDERISIINSDKKSYGYQMNLGLKAAKGEYIGIVETDDFIEPNMYEDLYELARKYDLDFVKANFYRFVEDEEGNKIFEPDTILKKKDLYSRVIRNNPKKVIYDSRVYIWSGIYKREFLLNNELFFNETPGASYQDNGFWFITSASAEKVYFSNKFYYKLRRDNPNSSFHSKAKVYCICDEYHYIYQFLQNHDRLYNRLISVYWVACFNNYRFTYERIAPEYRAEFMERFGKEFQEAKAKSELDESLFSEKQQQLLKRILADPRKFHQEQAEREDDKKKIPYLRRLRYCYEDNGLKYTIDHTFERFFKKEEEPEEIVKDYDYYSKVPASDYKKELEDWLVRKTYREMDLDHPISFNEKVQWLKLYDNLPIKTKLADKYLVRDYIRETIGEKYLIPLLGVWDRFDDIDFDALPDRFVLKANHGCGWNIIVKDKKQFDKEEARTKINEWLNTNFAYVNGFELQYKDIKPRIIAEEYIEQVDNGLYDYKVFCFNGEPRIIKVIGDRQYGHAGAREASYDPQWQRVSYIHHTYKEYEEDIPKPENLDEMMEVCRKLSTGFKLVRVDLYDVDGKIWFGEMTFTPASGISEWEKRSDNEMVGSWLKLD